MHMILMVAITLVVYLTCLALMIIYHKNMKEKIWNLMFCLIIQGFLIASYLYQYRNSGKIKFLTFDYISPFTFTTIPLMYILKDKVKQYYLSMVAFLCFGMFCAMLVSPQEAYLFSYKQEATLGYAFDAFAHLFCSLFGVYLVLSGQVVPNIKNWIKSMVFLYGVITVAVIINAIFNTNYFYMSPYGNYKIYFLNLFPTFWATITAFYLGIFLVLLTGFQLTYIMQYLIKENIIRTDEFLSEGQKNN